MLYNRDQNITSHSRLLLWRNKPLEAEDGKLDLEISGLRISSKHNLGLKQTILATRTRILYGVMRTCARSHKYMMM